MTLSISPGISMTLSINLSHSNNISPGLSMTPSIIINKTKKKTLSITQSLSISNCMGI